MPTPAPATKTPAQSQPAQVPRPVPAPRLPTIASPAVRLAPSLAKGEPLPTPVRTRLEGSFGVDLGAVRVHQDSQSQETAKRMGARAFTFGPNITLGPRERPDDLRLMAHEAAHVIQQRSAPAMQRFTSNSSDAYEAEAVGASEAVMRSQSFTVQQQTSPRPQAFLGIDIPNPLDWLAGKANIIPGFRMFTIVLGVNPINMSRVERSASNILKALIEFLPGGGLITQALENHGVFEKAGVFIEAQIATLAITGSAIKAAVTAFIDGLSLRRILTEPGNVWESAKRIFTEPIDRIIAFAKGTVTGVVKLIKDAILKPLAKLAEGTRGYDLLKAVMGEDPVTGEKVPRTPETLIGGFMKLIGQEEVWANIQKSKAIPRAWAWFQGALNGLLGFVRQIPTLFVNAFKSLEIADIILVPRAFAKIASVFGGFIGQFLSWAGNTVWSLLQIIFEVVAPAVMPYLKKAAGAFRTILKNPIVFVGNLVRAGKLGFEMFAGNFLEHLKAALIRWITGPLGNAGVYIPKSFSLLEIVKLVLSVLGLTWQNIRSKLVKIIPEPVLVGLEKTAGILVTLVRDGPAAAWEQIKTELSELKDQMIAQITQMVTTEIVKAAVKKLVMMLNPAGAFVQAIIAIYNTITFFIEKINQIAAVVASFIDSVSAIAAGQVGNAAKKVEQTMANTLTVVIAFLAKFAGLGDIPNKVVGVIKKIRQPIDKGLDKIVAWLGNILKKVGTAVLQAGGPQDPNERLRLAANAAVTAARRLSGRVTSALLQPVLKVIQIRYRLVSIIPYERGGTWWVRAVINPTLDQNLDVPSDGKAASGSTSKVTEGSEIQLVGPRGGWRPYKYRVTKVSAMHVEYQFVGTPAPQSALKKGITLLNKQDRLWRLYSPEKGDLPLDELLQLNGILIGDTAIKSMHKVRKVLNFRVHEKQSNPPGKEWEHIVEHSAGGPNSVKNLALADATVNRDLGVWFGQRMSSAPGFPNTGPLTVRQFLDAANANHEERERWKMRAYAIFKVSLKPTKDDGRGPYRTLE